MVQNSLTTNLKEYITCVFQDVKWLYPRPSGWERDLTRSLHELGRRGSRFLTLDLPALCKHFDQCLDQGAYFSSQLAFGRVNPRIGVPVFMQDLYLRIFDLEGKLRDSPCLDAIQALRTLLLSAKKIRIQCEEWRIDDAQKEFVNIERDLLPPTLDWDDDSLPPCDSELYGSLHYADYLQPGGQGGNLGQLCLFKDTDFVAVDPSRAALLRRLQHICDVVASELCAVDIHDVTTRPKHGPGVTAEQGRWDDKFLFPSWPSKLEHAFPYIDFGLPSWNFIDDPREHVPTCSERPSRMIAVPKTQKGPRLIAAEPTAHQWIQQLLWKKLEDSLASSSISRAVHFRDQSWNQDFAKRGSVAGAYATVDLSSASDRLTTRVVERMLRRNPLLLSQLHACRTRYMTYRVGSDTRFMRLKKFGPMGSAVTFPVQTIFYTCAALACLIREEAVTSYSIKKHASRISVFGDDIVIPTDGVEDLVWLLERLQFKINRDKTFKGSSFRESCGSEWFRGHDVSTAYLLEPPRRSKQCTIGSAVATRNNFYSRGYWHTARWVERIYLADRKVRRVPYGSPFAGIQTFCRPERVRKRFSHKLHRFEEFCLRPVTTVNKTVRDGVSRLFKWFVEEPLQGSNWDSDRIDSISSYWRWGWAPVSFATLYSVVKSPEA